MASAVAWLSPVSITGVMPRAFSSPMAAARRGLDRVGHREEGQHPGRGGQQADRAARLFVAVKHGLDLGEHWPRSSIRRWLPST